MTETTTILRQEVQRQGVIPFARFMELALYCPNSGYYEQPERRIGRKGDFYTSVSVGPLFGGLLAFQLASWIGVSGGSKPQLVEAGAHDGQLAHDVLTWTARHRPTLFEAIEYWIVEPSPRRQSWQREKLDIFAGRVRWTESLEDLPRAGVTGVVFSNELLDAFPVHRLGWDSVAAEWFEWGVALEGETFVWRRLNPNQRDWAVELKLAGFELPPELLAVLPGGFTLEVCPKSADWWRTAASRIKQGRLMTIDYGLAAEELVSPGRTNGTLRAYHRHCATEELLAHPGDQDLTAHVNFSQLQRVGEDAGLTTELFIPQARFLTSIAEAFWRELPAGEAPSPSEARQFQTLTHPSHLGRAFRVLVQSK